VLSGVAMSVGELKTTFRNNIFRNISMGVAGYIGNNE